MIRGTPSGRAGRQDHFLAKLTLRVDRDPLGVLGEWGERFTVLRERADYEGCRQLLQGAKGWDSLPAYARATILYAEGWLYDRLGEVEAALRAHTRAHEAFGQAEMSELSPSLLTQIGSLHEDLGNYEVAREKYELALSLASTDDERGRIEINLGVLAMLERNLAAAGKAYRRALELIPSTDERNIAAARHGLANALQAEGRFAEAQGEFVEAERRFRSIGDRLGSAVCEGSLGVLEIIAGTPSTAIALLRYSLTIFQQHSDVRRSAATLNNLAIAHNQAGDLLAAASLWRQSEAVYLELGQKEDAEEVRVRAEAAEATALQTEPET
jgi:tetratricopeptide (TPR) repeat protein